MLSPQETVWVSVGEALMGSGHLPVPHNIDRAENRFFCETARMFWLAAINRKGYVVFPDPGGLLPLAELADFLTEDQEERPG
jgi:hypothetical protein